MGDPLPPSYLGRREFARLTKASGVRRIKFHGLRHTSATLALRAGVPVRVISARLGHKDATVTLRVYAHVLPDMQEMAAAKLGQLLNPLTGS